jgi:hypothetical protein
MGGVHTYTHQVRGTFLYLPLGFKTPLLRETWKPSGFDWPCPPKSSCFLIRCPGGLLEEQLDDWWLLKRTHRRGLQPVWGIKYDHFSTEPDRRSNNRCYTYIHRLLKVANESDHTKNTIRKLNNYERLCSRKEKENKNDYCTRRPL